MNRIRGNHKQSKGIGDTQAFACRSMGDAVFFQAEDGIRDIGVTGVQTCALPICLVAAAFVRGRTGRGGLIALGLVLSLGLVVASAEPWEHASGGVGDRTYVPTDADAVRSVYEGGLGDMTLDLTRVDVSDLSGPITTQINHGVGDLEVLLPRDADARISVNTGVGSVDVLDQGAPRNGFFPGTGS